ncbi:MAG TPA: putative cytokinetic ring protein SteA [Armatimonadota bacterium]|nr:putative cytokinetic ring protein SteA [Armatimonadota bacterium]
MRIRGKARVDRRTKNLIHRLAPGEIAVISHTDLDAPCASALAERRVAAVVNAQRSLSGRFPHPGPGIVLKAGIPIIDHVGESVMQRLRDGDSLEIIDGSLYANGDLLAEGQLITAEELERQLEEAKRNVTGELARFVENTMSYVTREQSLLFDSFALPALRTRIKGRHCLLVVRGPGAAGDLRAIRSYVAAVDPVIIGVDGGADLLLHEGYRPDIIIGDMDSVSDAALQSGAELVVHAYPNGDAPGKDRLRQLHCPFVVLPARGTSEDVAMLLAFEKEAELIAAVGTHFSLDEFLEKGRGGMSSTFLVRLRVGSILVDAKGVSRLYPAGPSRRLFFYMVAVAGLIMFVLLTTAPAIRATLDLWMLRLSAFFRSIPL